MARWILAGLLLLAVTGVAAVGPPLEISAAHAPLAPTAQPGGDAEPTGNESPANASAGSAHTQMRFQETAESVGFAFRGDTAVKGTMSNRGVYAADYDNDGWTDLLAIGGRNVTLFENTGGQFAEADQLPRFERPMRAAAFFDYDGDGWDDLLVLPVRGEPLFFANEEGTFTRRDVGFDARMSVPIGAAVADYDGNGCLDVLVVQNGNWSEHRPRGQVDSDFSFDADNGNPNHLFAGNCSAFRRVEDAGLRGAHWSLAASFTDFTGDGRPDVHVGNDFNNDLVYVNRGDGTFSRRVLSEATDRNAMSSEVFDANGDGRMDLFVTNIYHPMDLRERINQTGSDSRPAGNNLLVNQGNGSFVDRAREYGVRRGGWGWAAVAADFDNDGDRDLFHATMNVEFRFFSREKVETIRDRYSYYAQPVLFERKAGGFVSKNPDLVGFERSNTHGVAALDFDRDGDLDLAATDEGGFDLYENRGRVGNALQVDLVGATGADALGARITVSVAGDSQTAVVNSRTDYLSQDARVTHFGLGNASRADVRVAWPDGTVTRLDGVAAGQRIVVSKAGIESRIPFEET